MSNFQNRKIPPTGGSHLPRACFFHEGDAGSDRARLEGVARSSVRKARRRPRAIVRPRLYRVRLLPVQSDLAISMG